MALRTCCSWGSFLTFPTLGPSLNKPQPSALLVLLFQVYCSSSAPPCSLCSLDSLFNMHTFFGTISAHAASLTCPQAFTPNLEVFDNMGLILAHSILFSSLSSTGIYYPRTLTTKHKRLISFNIPFWHHSGNTRTTLPLFSNLLRSQQNFYFPSTALVSVLHILKGNSQLLK